MTVKISDADFVEAWKRAGSSPSAVAKLTGLTIGGVYRRRNFIAMKGVILPTVSGSPNRHGRNGLGQAGWQQAPNEYKPRIDETVRDGVVMVASDCHYWPGIITLAHKAFVALARELQPKMIVLNGDIFDGARISRHDPMGWQKLPTVLEELEACKARLAEIERAAPKAKKRRTVGNHDSRFDRRLATETSDFDGVPGFSLRDHLKTWGESYSVMLNEELGHPVMIRHAMRGGIHAVWNNTLHAGVSIVTGHLHAQLCRPFTDYRGTRYGVDCGTLADIDGPQFSYTMDGPVNWRSGFAVLTFDKAGRLLPPELCEVQRFGKEQRAIFRGQVVSL